MKFLMKFPTKIALPGFRRNEMPYRGVKFSDILFRYSDIQFGYSNLC